MGAAAVSAVDLFAAIIREHAPEDIWQGSPLIGYRSLGNTNRGEIGEEFVRRYLREHGLDAGNGNRTSRIDMRIAGRRFEVKTASLGAGGAFQFNHVRLDRGYDFLLCIGVCPREIRFGVWRKGAVAEGAAGKLVRMAEGQAVTYKITKKLRDLRPVEDMPEAVARLAAGRTP